MVYTLPIPRHKYAHCKLEVYRNRVILVSYYTDVAIFNITDRTVVCNGTFSATTSRHLRWFSEYLFNVNLYHTFKNNIYKPIPLTDTQYDNAMRVLKLDVD